MMSADEKRIVKARCKKEMKSIRTKMQTIDEIFKIWEAQDDYNWGHEGSLKDLRHKLEDMLDGLA